MSIRSALGAHRPQQMTDPSCSNTTSARKMQGTQVLRMIDMFRFPALKADDIAPHHKVGTDTTPRDGTGHHVIHHGLGVSIPRWLPSWHGSTVFFRIPTL